MYEQRTRNIVTVTVNVEVVSDVQYSLDGINYVPSNTFTNLAPEIILPMYNIQMAVQNRFLSQLTIYCQLLQLKCNSKCVVLWRYYRKY
ncbi:hypothetical protein H9W95_03905 [Flavobacterium lindanitolerans]|nr:hypothetical protein [Flavobacterium lindanitolerans]